MALNGKEKLFVSSGGAGRSGIPLEEIAAFINANAPAPEGALVTNGASIPVHNSAGIAVGANCTAVVANDALSAVTLPATTVPVIAGTGIAIHSNTGVAVGANGLAAISGSNIVVTLPATTAAVVNAASVPVKDDASNAIPGVHSVTVTAGAVTDVTLAAPVAAVQNSIKVTVPITGAVGTGITFTVLNGVITAGVLS